VRRSLPPPRSISPQAQAFLAAAPPPPALPAAADTVAWRTLQAEEAARAQANVAPVLDAQPVSRRREGRIDVVRPHALDPATADLAVLYFHGGSLVFGAGVMAAAHAISTAMRLQAEVYGVDYRTPPGFPYPAALDDAVEAYRWLLERFEPGRIAFVGNSAGANLAAAAILRGRDAGLPLPRCAVLDWPQVDLTESGDSFQANADIDLTGGSTAACNALYAGGADLADPLLSPLFGDFAPGFPPTQVTSGTRDAMLSNAVRLHRNLLRAGATARLHVWEAAPHGGFGGRTPEDLEMFAQTRRFLADPR
jgi:acetyl esterase/lipase